MSAVIHFLSLPKGDGYIEWYACPECGIEYNLFSEHALCPDCDQRKAPKDRTGWYPKYSVKKLHDPQQKHKNCEYFVLDLTHDPHARTALKTYIDSCREEQPNLAADLTEILGSLK